MRLAEHDRAELTTMGGTPFEPMPGRPMTGFLVLPAELRSPEAARPWLERAFAYATSLPAKVKR